VRRIRLFGLTIVAALSLSVVAASAASAHLFEAEKYPVKVKAKTSNPQGFEIPGAVSVCQKGTFEGSATGASETLEVHPVYSECTVSIGAVKHVAAEVVTTGCNYKFHAAAVGTTEGTVDVDCGEISKGVYKKIEIKIPSISGCVISVTGHPAKEAEVAVNQGLKTVEYKNEPANKVTVNAKVSNIKWAAESACGLAGTEGTTAKYEGGEVTSVTEINKLTGGPATAVSEGLFGELNSADPIKVN